jgi:hypothetical protein
MTFLDRAESAVQIENAVVCISLVARKTAASATSLGSPNRRRGIIALSLSTSPVVKSRHRQL